MQIGFVSTRLAGTDGVSLEARKWADVLSSLDHQCFCFAGEVDWPPERSYVVSEAHFNHPEVRALSESLFGHSVRSSETSQAVQALKGHLTSHLYRFVDAFAPDLLIVENALAIPMNVPLGLALTEFIAETEMPTIGHHHDFSWERARFWPNAASDYLCSAFPPTLPSVRHVVINSIAAEQLAFRIGVGSMLIPNVMDFESPPADSDDYAADLRSTLGIARDEWLILQPTRIVPRKGIERAIELVGRLSSPATLVISHASGDEGTAYKAYLQNYAKLMGVRVLFAADMFDHRRRETPDGRKVYDLRDVYQVADLVTYPSNLEGFGNAFLEAVYHRRPVVVNRYEVFKTDIQPKGFEVIAFDGFATQETVRQVEALLQDPARTAEVVERNYEVGQRYYSYRTLGRGLRGLLDNGWKL
jgi:glycosyltransferase involved in cell wall biosynthesis